MKTLFLTVTGLIFGLLFSAAEAQKLIPNKSVTGVCYAGTKVNRIYIPPRKGVLEKFDRKGGGVIRVSYTGFPSQAQTAVEYAINILEAMLPAGTDIFVRTSWAKISSTGVLGNSSITGYAAGWGINALEPFAWYPVTVAEKIAGEGLNENSDADVELVLNSSINWYLGTDGNTPSNRYDLVTVVLHELCHGLGFFDSMDTENSLGFYGLGTTPVVYDTFIENLAGRNLTDTLLFRQNSSQLYEQLTGGQLYFNGPVSTKYMSGVRPRLYAPSTWDPGSSISHLDELRTSEENSLMTPFIDLGEAIHDPGGLTFSILGDIGWIHTKIKPGELKDSEQLLTQVNVTAEIESDTTYNKDNVGLVYSFDGFETSDTLLMIPVSSGDSYSRSVPVSGYNVRLDYYLFAEDAFHRIYKYPALADTLPFTVYIGVDTIKPVISHNPNAYYFERVDSIPFTANVSDNLAIDTVYVEYNVNGGAAGFFGLGQGEKDEFTTAFNVRPLSLAGGDLINYRIVAVDRANARNTRFSPSTGFYTTRIESLGTVVETYSTDFTDATSDFFNSGFVIARPAGFSSPGLHSEHPYVSPDEDDAHLETSSVLRHPVKFDPSGMVLSFREVVLVEPGNEGSIFGFTDFYDYVIVEGSGNFGKTWFPLADGYDARWLPSWETSYNSSIDGQNSTFEGTESMMVTHTFYPRIENKIEPGDSILIRFRLYVDPYARGWGWAIDDLKIGPLVDNVDENELDGLRIYPNPGKGILTFSTGGTVNFVPERVTVYTNTGQRLLDENVTPDSELRIDLSGYPSGMYYIKVTGNSGVRTFKYSLIR